MMARPLDQSVFLDASYVIALVNPNDLHHSIAKGLADELEARKIRLFTTTGIILEVGNSLSKAKYREAATEVVGALLNDAAVTKIPITDSLVTRAHSLFAKRLDKEWGLTDCCSFVTMADAKITQALTADRHFIQAGYTALLL